METTDQIRDLIVDNSSLSASDVSDASADLFAAGLSSLDCVRILLAVEDELELELPEELINRELFTTVANLAAAVKEILGAAA